MSKFIHIFFMSMFLIISCNKDIPIELKSIVKEYKHFIRQQGEFVSFNIDYKYDKDIDVLLVVDNYEIGDPGQTDPLPPTKQMHKNISENFESFINYNYFGDINMTFVVITGDGYAGNETNFCWHDIRQEAFANKVSYTNDNILEDYMPIPPESIKIIPFLYPDNTNYIENKGCQATQPISFGIQAVSYSQDVKQWFNEKNKHFMIIFSNHDEMTNNEGTPVAIGEDLKNEYINSINNDNIKLIAATKDLGANSSIQEITNKTGGKLFMFNDSTDWHALMYNIASEVGRVIKGELLVVDGSKFEALDTGDISLDDYEKTEVYVGADPDNAQQSVLKTEDEYSFIINNKGFFIQFKEDSLPQENEKIKLKFYPKKVCIFDYIIELPEKVFDGSEYELFIDGKQVPKESYTIDKENSLLIINQAEILNYGSEVLIKYTL